MNHAKESRDIDFEEEDGSSGGAKGGDSVDYDDYSAKVSLVINLGQPPKKSGGAGQVTKTHSLAMKQNSTVS